MRKRREWCIHTLRQTFKLVDGVIYRKWKDGWLPAKLHTNNQGYHILSYQKKHILAHRLIYMLYHGYNPIDLDHFDGNRTNNTISNLREVTHRENHQNLACHRNGSLPGARYDKKESKWKVDVQIQGKKLHLGGFNTEQEAHDIYTLAVFLLPSYKNHTQFQDLVRKTANLAPITKHEDAKGYTKQDNGYTARISVKGKEVYLGYYNTEEQASAAYNQAKQLLQYLNNNTEDFKQLWNQQGNTKAKKNKL